MIIGRENELRRENISEGVCVYVCMCVSNILDNVLHLGFRICDRLCRVNPYSSSCLSAYVFFFGGGFPLDIIFSFFEWEKLKLREVK